MNKLIKKSFHRKDSGFTLIELLIVIVIIGILAGVLIAVINPVRQQNRSRNAAVRAAVLKAAFAVNTVRAGVGSLPSNSTLSEELENITPTSATLCDETNGALLDCYFTISGTQMPGYCTAGAESIPVATGGVDCSMHLVSISTDLRDGQFRIASAKFPLDTVNGTYEFYVFDSSNGLLRCPSTFTTYATATEAQLTAGCVPASDE